ncbi:MAG: hypothetical protein IT381_28655 [Deltaproteobacteria bacterium]|nr:hypothetical protein [Deltaproteobacteria bacterium]
MALALLVLWANDAVAKELVHTDSGVVLETSTFYKTLLSAFVVQPETVTSTRDLARLLREVATVAGAPLPEASLFPAAGAINGHIGRLSARLRVKEWVEVEVAWQLALSLASDPVFSSANTLGTTVGGIGQGAQRRLFELSGTLASGASARLDHNLDRLAVKIALPFGDLIVGRQVLSWGTGRIWNPTDVLSPFPPTAIDREVRRGFDAVRLLVAIGDVTQLDLLYLPQLVPAEMGAVARFRTNTGDWDWSLSFGKYVRDLVIGADLAGDLGPVSIHAEGAYTIELAGLGAGAVNVGEHFFRGVVGAEVKPSEKLMLALEYSYNGYGTTDAARYATVLASARVVRGEIFGAGAHQAALAMSVLAHDLLSLQLAMLVNLTDPSMLFIPSLEFSLTQTVLMRAGAYVPLGRGPDPFVFRRLRANDVLSGSDAYRQTTASRGLQSEYGSASFGAFLQVGVYLP